MQEDEGPFSQKEEEEGGGGLGGGGSGLMMFVATFLNVHISTACSSAFISWDFTRNAARLMKIWNRKEGLKTQPVIQRVKKLRSCFFGGGGVLVVFFYTMRRSKPPPSSSLRILAGKEMTVLYFNTITVLYRSLCV